MSKRLIVFVLLILNLPIWAQFKVFSENMGNTSVGTSTPTARLYQGFENYGQNGITYSADIGSTATVRNNTSSSSGYTTASGYNFLSLQGNASAFFSINNIPVTSATGIQISFGVSKSLTAEDGNSLVLEVSVDGATPITFSPTLPTGSGSTQWYYVTPALSIPNGNLLSLNFKNISTTTVSYRLDDILITSATPLPVTFGSVQAARNSEKLNISWVTLSETNNDHFDIEISKNGSDFIKAATIQSKSVSANSDMLVKYEYTIPLRQIITAILPFLYILLPLGLIKRSQKLLIVSAVFFITCFSISCNKVSIAESRSVDKIFVRIAQIDTDGTKTYSKTVLAVQE